MPEQRADCKTAIYEDTYADYLIEATLVEQVEREFPTACLQVVNSKIVVVHQERMQDENLLRYGYSALPKCYGLMDSSSMEEIGVFRLRRQPFLDLLGRDVILAFLDTGIDYKNKLFQNADGTTRILTIWDQTMQAGPAPEEFSYGTEYTREQINRQLEQTQETIVQTQDTDGHGTFLAAIAAGGIDEENDFTGVAPLADIVVVKLKEAKPYLREFYHIKEDEVCYQENDILLALKYINLMAMKYRKPVAVCIGLGSNSGDHNGNSILDEYLDRMGRSIGIGVAAAAGNELGRGGHYFGQMKMDQSYQTVELRVGAKEKGFVLELWANAPQQYSLGFISPGGEYIGKITAQYEKEEEISFLLEPTKIFLYYRLVEARSGDYLAFIRFHFPTEGIWKILVYNDLESAGQYHMWLPIYRFLSDETYFIQSEPDVTICGPANTMLPVTVAAYQHQNGSLYLHSSRGYTRNGGIKPDITAPGVGVYGPNLSNGFTTKTGTSIAAAHVAGASALLLEWGLLKGNYKNMDTREIKKFLIRGANRGRIEYPNREWGYGTLDIYNTFNSLRRTMP